MPKVIVAVTFLVFASTRLTVPSPWFKVQIEPPPDVRNRGFGPTGSDTGTSPVRASTAAKTLLSNPVTQMIPLLKSGLYEPGGMEIFCRTAPVVGSIRLSVPFLSVTIQIRSPLTVIPPSGPVGPSGSVAMTLFLSTSTRTSEGFLPHSGTQRLPNPVARPEHASPDKLTFETILLVAGSIRRTE
jgi:hypothetical protein